MLHSVEKVFNKPGFFEAIKSVLNKTTQTNETKNEKSEYAIKQILSKAVISDRIVDIFEAAGITKTQRLNTIRRIPAGSKGKCQRKTWRLRH